MAFCSKCGVTIVAGSAFCNGCGQPVNSQGPVMEGAPSQAARSVEHKFFDDGNTLVTNTRVVRGNVTFAMSGITSVKSFPEFPSKKGPIALIVIGALTFLAALRSSVGVALSGAVLVALGIWWLRSIKTIYHVRLVTASSEKDAVGDTNAQYINSIVDAINQAIIHRG
jgi:Family of unknown function (DUF6232)